MFVNKLRISLNSISDLFQLMTSSVQVLKIISIIVIVGRRGFIYHLLAVKSLLVSYCVEALDKYSTVPLVIHL